MVLPEFISGVHTDEHYFTKEQLLAKKQQVKHSPALGRLTVIVNYLKEDVRRGPVQFKIAIFSIFIIVTFISILVNARALMMAIFIGMAEQAVGDTDFMISKISFSDNQFGATSNIGDILLSNFIDVNQTQEKLKSVEELMGSSPRWILPGTVYNPIDKSMNTSTNIIIGDSLAEISFSIGRALRLPPLASGEAYIMKSVKNMAELKGDIFTLKLDLLKYFRALNLVNATDSESESDLDFIKTILRDTLPANISISTAATVQTFETNFPGLGLTDVQRDQLSAPIDIQLENVIDPTAQIILDAISLETSLKARTVIESPEGKWPDALGNVVFVDSDYYLELFSDRMLSALRTLAANLTETTLAQNQNGLTPLAQDQISLLVQGQIQALFVEPLSLAFQNFNLTNKAMTLAAVVKDKVAIYSSFNTYQDTLVQLSNKISQRLGDPGDFSIIAPMFLGFQVLGFVSIFIQNIVYMILVLLAILAIVLLASLMVFSIDEKTYEFGMLRALGFQRQNLVLMLVLQAGVFAVAGWCFGVLLSWMVSSGLQILFFLDIRMLTRMRYDTMAWIVTVIFGFLIPIIVNVYSIRNSLAESLKDSLDLYHRTIGAMTVIFVKLEKLGISNTVFVVSIELTIYGFLFYYVAPYLFFLNRFDLFVYLFNSILLATIIAMTVIANIFQKYFELACMWLCWLVLGKNRPLVTVINKNLQAHVNSNRKTSIMLALCVCFIIFSGSGIFTQVNSIVSQIVNQNGSDLSVVGNPLDEVALKEFLDQPRIKAYVDSYSFISRHLRKYPYVSKVEISPQSFFPVFQATITAIDENFTKAFYQKYYTPDEYKQGETFETLSNGQKDGISPIFTGNNKLTEMDSDPNNIYSGAASRVTRTKIRNLNMKGVIPTGLVELTSISVDTPARVRIKIDEEDILTDFTVVHTANKVPGMGFSQYVLSVQGNHDILVSMESYGEVLNLFREQMQQASQDKQDNFFEWDNEIVQRSTFKVPKTRLIVKMKDSASKQDRDVVKNGIKNRLKSTDSVTDAIDLGNSAKSALKYLGYLNILIATLTCLISFFMLLISLMKKIKDNIWELGVLRSMGVNIRQVFIIYFIETAAVIVSALILGTCVGLAISKVSTVFYFIFFEIDLGLGFPVPEFLVLLAFLLLTTLLTSVIGLRSFIYLPISKLLKGLV